MVVNPLKAKLDAGRAVGGFLVTMPGPALVQHLAAAGADMLVIDTEHGQIGTESAHAMIAATAGTDCAPLVRPAGIAPWMAKQALDGGAYGMFFPMVCSQADAEATVRALCYPPAGVRGFGPIQAPARWGVSQAEYAAAANEQILNVVQIEHIDAVEAVDEILGVPGIDVAFIAPYDLSCSLGRGGQLDHPDVLAAIARAEARILAHGAVLGGLAPTAEAVRAALDRGYRFLLLGLDAGLLAGAATTLLDGMRG